MKTDAWGVCMECVESNARSEREQTWLAVGGNLDRDDPEFDILLLYHAPSHALPASTLALE